MTRAEQDVTTTARLYECRTAARFILGERYAVTIDPWRRVLSEQMARGDQSVLQAALSLGQRIPSSDGAALMLIMAAAVEMIEQPGSGLRGGLETTD